MLSGLSVLNWIHNLDTFVMLMVFKLKLNRLILLALFASCTVSLAEAKRGKGPPKWLLEASERAVPQHLTKGGPDVVYLHDEGRYEVEPDGTIVVTNRVAMRIRKGAGADEAVANLYYSEDTDKPVSIKAWTLPPERKKGVKPIEYRNRDVGDAVVAGAAGSVITTSRRRFIDASGDAMAGSVFGFETVMKDQGSGPELGWRFQTEYPVLWSSVSLSLPGGWDYRAHVIGEGELSREEDGVRVSWEARELIGLERQPYGIAKPLALGLAVVAPDGERDELPNSWGEMARHYWPYYSSDRELTPEMESKVSSLTDGLGDPWAAARALAEFSQSVNYLSIALDLGSGGGYRPRSPEDVFRSNYGDCKDKTNLLLALLGEKGVEAYPLIVNWGDESGNVDTAWVSPMQFNHCIAAIKVPESYASPNVVHKEGVGNLFIFDPTNEHTVFGDIATGLQGKKGLLLAGDSGGLITIPQLPLEACEVRRTVSAYVGLAGVEGTLKEVSQGQNAASERRFAFTNDRHYQDRVLRWLAESIPGVRVLEMQSNDNRERNTFTLDTSFFAQGYGKNLRNRTLIYKPVLMGRMEALPFGEEEREQDVKLKPQCLVEAYQLSMPEGFEVSELPEDQSFEERFGSYELDFEYDTESHSLKVERTIRIEPLLVPVEDYASLERFFRRRIKADKSTVVLEAL